MSCARILSPLGRRWSSLNTLLLSGGPHKCYSFLGRPLCLHTMGSAGLISRWPPMSPCEKVPLQPLFSMVEVCDEARRMSVTALGSVLSHSSLNWPNPSNTHGNLLWMSFTVNEVLFGWLLFTLASTVEPCSFQCHIVYDFKKSVKICHHLTIPFCGPLRWYLWKSGCHQPLPSSIAACWGSKSWKGWEVATAGWPSLCLFWHCVVFNKYTWKQLNRWIV